MEGFVKAALDGGPEPAEPWRPLLSRADARRAEAEEKAARERAGGSSSSRRAASAAAWSARIEEAAKRDGRRARAEVLDLGLTLAAIGFRDLICVAEGADEAVLGSDRAAALAGAARGRDSRRLREAAERCEDLRQALELNVNEELALSALGFRLANLVGAPA